MISKHAILITCIGRRISLIVFQLKRVSGSKQQSRIQLWQQMAKLSRVTALVISTDTKRDKHVCEEEIDEPSRQIHSGQVEEQRYTHSTTLGNIFLHHHHSQDLQLTPSPAKQAFCIAQSNPIHDNRLQLLKSNHLHWTLEFDMQLKSNSIQTVCKRWVQRSTSMINQSKG